MHFEHLIEINDPALTHVQPLTRRQLWRGLVIRAERPQLSVIGLDDCRIVARSEAGLVRELRFGGLTIRDQVLFSPMDSVTYDTEPTDAVPAARLVMAIEEPLPGRLFVRFSYERGSGPPAEADNALYTPFVREAYVRADIDTIVTIRQLALDGILDDQFW